MKEILTSPISRETARIALLIFIIMCSVLVLYRFHTYTYLTIEFDDARPIRNKIPVYFKGYRIGKVEKIVPSNDFRSTFVKIVLYPKHLKLPANTTALLTREKRERHEIDYINLLSPDTPSEYTLSNGDRIIGITTVDVESYFSAKALSGELDEIKDNINNLLLSLKSTGEALTMFLEVLRDTVNENRPSIKVMTENLTKSSDELKIFTYKLNNSINENELKSTFSNLNQTSSSVVITTKNLEGITQNIDSITGGVNRKTTQITTSITNADKIAKNIEIITTGIKNTMSKNFGGLRLLFGKSIRTDKYIRKCD